jgi:anti-sigma regulatory factor (Ser/Thr protein kinase)
MTCVNTMNILEVPGRCMLGELQSSREWIIPSSLTQIRSVVSEALAELGERPDLGAIELALHEALANAISHGNQDSISKAVRVTLARRHWGSVVLVVKDCGNGFDVNKVPEPLGDHLMSERGRGIFLMRQLVAWVDFVHDHGTEVRLWLNPPTLSSELRDEPILQLFSDYLRR